MIISGIDISQISFSWPWVLLLLPLPLLVRLLLPASNRTQDAPLHVPSLDDFSSAQQSESRINKNRLMAIITGLAWMFLIIASARPHWLGDRVDIPVSGRDLMMAVDLSVSMDTEDFSQNGRSINRLETVKNVAGDFIKQREGDRVGLILFGAQAYLQTPLTFDTTTVNTMLQEALIGIAGDATAIGDAIGLAIKRLHNESAEDKVLILLTDGANTAGEVLPLQAAKLAAEHQLKIYTIGVGAETMEVGRFIFKQTIRNKQIDEKTLQEISRITGGRYYRARNTTELNNIYTLIEELEPIERDNQSFRPAIALYTWPLSIALFLAMLVVLLPIANQVILIIKGFISSISYKATRKT